MGKLEVYKRSDGKWAWRLKARNGQVIATDGSQGYNSGARAREMAARVLSGEFAKVEPQTIGDVGEIIKGLTAK